MRYSLNGLLDRAGRAGALAALTAACFAGVTSTAEAQITAPGLVKGINAGITGQQDNLALDSELEGPSFIGSTPPAGGDPATGVNIFASGAGAPYGIDGLGDLNGNQVLVVTQEGASAFDGAGFTVSVSNGENGAAVPVGTNTGFVFDGLETPFSDPSNPVAADPVFNTIGNSSGRLENGNVVRFSTWVQNDASAPLTVEPQIAPIVKLEFWRDGLGGVADNTGGVTNPGFGSRIFDTDQNGSAISDPDQRARILDINGDGNWSFGAATEPAPQEGIWQQIVHTYVINDAAWDIVDTPAVETVADVEEIRGVMFMGDFTGGNLGGPGNLLWDNALIEIFADTTAEAASDVLLSNPSPINDEGVAIPGDFDGDGDVDGADFGVFVGEFQTGDTGGPGADAPFSQADLNESGFVDGADFGIFVDSFQNFPPTPAAVPEPTSVALVCLVMASASGLATRRR